MSSAGAENTARGGAARLFAARSAMAEAKRRAQRPALAELAMALTDPRRDLCAAGRRVLLSDLRLRADFNRLKVRLGCIELPALMAASGGEETSLRRFGGGTVRVHPSRVAGQVYVLFQFMWPQGSPQAVLLEGASGEVVKRALPAADASGRAVLVLDQKRAPDELFLRLITEPTTTGSFIL
jgi:hypothetical protein